MASSERHRKDPIGRVLFIHPAAAAAAALATTRRRDLWTSPFLIPPLGVQKGAQACEMAIVIEKIMSRLIDFFLLSPLFFHWHPPCTSMWNSPRVTNTTWSLPQATLSLISGDLP